MTDRQRQSGVTRREVVYAGGAMLLGLSGWGLAGCGGKSGPTAGNGAAAAPASGRSGAAKAKIQLRYWTFLDPKDPGGRSKAQQDAIAGFQSKYPHVEIVPEVMAWQQIDSRLIQAAQAGNGPDVTRVAANSVALQAEAGTVVPLDDYVKGWSADQKADFHGNWDDALIDGHKYSLPLEVSGTMFCYRTDLVHSTGQKAPQTWDEYGQVAKALTKAPVWGATVGVSRKNNASNLWQVFLPHVWALGGQVFNGKKAVVDTPEWEEVFSYWVRLVNGVGAAPKDIVAQTTDTIMEGYIAGTYATMFNQNQKLAAVVAAKTLPKDSLGIATMPGAVAGKPGPNPLAGWHIAVCKDTKHRDEAWAFAEWTTNREAQTTGAKLADSVPSRKSSGTDPWFQTPEAKYVKAYLDVISASGRTINYPPKFNELADMLAVGIQNVLVKGTKAKDELREAAKAYNAMVQA